MGTFIKGEVVSIPFPFSDLSHNKRRPALVIADIEGRDIILCVITATRSDMHSIPLMSTDFRSGSLDKDSYIRPSKLFTADEGLVVESKGLISDIKIAEVISRLKDIIEN